MSNDDQRDEVYWTLGAGGQSNNLRQERVGEFQQLQPGEQLDPLPLQYHLVPQEGRTTSPVAGPLIMSTQLGFATADLQVVKRPQKLTERQIFFFFVRILFRILGGDNRMRQRAKAVVAECTKRNRLGDSNYTPLMDSIERRLRPTVGEHCWIRAKDCLHHCMRRRGISASSITVPTAV